MLDGDAYIAFRDAGYELPFDEFFEKFCKPAIKKLAADLVHNQWSVRHDAYKTLTELFNMTPEQFGLNTAAILERRNFV